MDAVDRSGKGLKVGAKSFYAGQAVEVTQLMVVGRELEMNQQTGRAVVDQTGNPKVLVPGDWHALVRAEDGTETRVPALALGK